MTPLSWQKAPSTSARAARAVEAVAVGAVGAVAAAAVGAVAAAAVGAVGATVGAVAVGALTPTAAAAVSLSQRRVTPPAWPSLFGRLAQMANSIKQRVTCALSNTARLKVMMDSNAAATNMSAIRP